MNRQSALLTRSVSLLELPEVQRDSDYEETKLAVKYRQGKEASTAFNRHRRLPALTVGTSLLLCGAAPSFYSAPKLYHLLGFTIGILPGTTLVLLSILPTDHVRIIRWMKLMAGFCAVFALTFMNRGIVIASSLFDEENSCIDYRGVTVPCWISAIHTMLYALLAVLCFEVVRRLVVRLCTKQHTVSSRFEFSWGLWGTWLWGYTFTTVFFVAPYFCFEEGRLFLGTATGIFEMLSLVATSSLGKLASTKSYYTELQQWLSTSSSSSPTFRAAVTRRWEGQILIATSSPLPGTFGTVTDAMAIATLMSQGDDKPLEEVMTAAKKKLRYVTLSSMDISDFNFAPSGGFLHSKYAKSVHCEPRDIDVFVSHSWRDPPLPKWEALKLYCSEFSNQHNREARIWIDAYCVDPDSPPEPQLHPVYLMSSERLLVLLGPTYLSRAWCVFFELFMFVEAGASTKSIDVLSISETTLPADDVDITLCECALETDRTAIEEVIASCGSAAKFKRRLSDILRAITMTDNTTHGTKRGLHRRSRRLSGTILLQQELGHLARQFETAKPGCWWQVVIFFTCLSPGS